MPKTSMARRQSAVPVRTAEERRQDRIDALGYTGQERDVLREIGQRMRRIVNGPSKDRDAIAAAAWLTQQIGPAVGAHRDENDNPPPLINLIRVEAPAPSAMPRLDTKVIDANEF
jgi:hypothetical protein